MFGRVNGEDPLYAVNTTAAAISYYESDSLTVSTTTTTVTPSQTTFRCNNNATVKVTLKNLQYRLAIKEVSILDQENQRVGLASILPPASSSSSSSISSSSDANSTSTESDSVYDPNDHIGTVSLEADNSTLTDTHPWCFAADGDNSTYFAQRYWVCSDF